jgi:hypothetical protein
MITFRTYFFCFLVLALSKVFAQNNKFDFRLPLDINTIITGNYGELRPNHFHAGLDFRTHPVDNLPIKAVQDGYVSRIKISRAGYGKVLYITHANGYVSVYAHQKRFSTTIENYVKQKQIEQQKNEIELFLKPTELVVKKNDVIGFTGNSGSSQAPHLHFEIRDEKTEVPVNPLLWYSIPDKVKPVITHIGLFDLKDSNQISLITSVAVDAKSNVLITTKNTLNIKSNKVGVAFTGYDQADVSTNKNNIYEAKLFVDGKLIYHHQLDNISFDDARYVNYFGEKRNGIKLQKCFPANCYGASIYKMSANNSVIELNDTLSHVIVLEVYDERQNKNSISFFIKSNLLSSPIVPRITNAGCDKDYDIVKNEAVLKIPKGALTRSLFIPIYLNKLGILTIGQKDEIILKPIQLSVRVNKPVIGKESKMVLINEGNCLIGKYENGFYKTETKQLGMFELAYDTIAPDIQWLNKPKPGKLIKNVLQIKIQDKLSGIGEYYVFVNEIWQIAEFDAKTGTLICETNLNGKVRVEVTDKVGNKSVKNISL